MNPASVDPLLNIVCNGLLFRLDIYQGTVLEKLRGSMNAESTETKETTVSLMSLQYGKNTWKVNWKLCQVGLLEKLGVRLGVPSIYLSIPAKSSIYRILAILHGSMAARIVDRLSGVYRIRPSKVIFFGFVRRLSRDDPACVASSVSLIVMSL